MSNKWKTSEGRAVIYDCNTESTLDTLKKATAAADAKRVAFLCSELVQEVSQRQAALAR